MTDQRRGRDGPQGPDGRQGLDGREGDAGVRGERGESTTGERGARGHEGHVGRAGPLGVGLFIVLVIYITTLSWGTDTRSCQRSNGSREAVRTFGRTAFSARTAAATIDQKKLTADLRSAGRSGRVRVVLRRLNDRSADGRRRVRSLIAGLPAGARADAETYMVDHGASIRYALSVRQASRLDCVRVFPETRAK